ncbi:MAG: FAD:protein FMN transferase [Treponema sp.]|jgi:thiamine biosynthesis lipoprotein|nr:FAD:protein FMN transferase [Treponema sp.]
MTLQDKPRRLAGFSAFFGFFLLFTGCIRAESSQSDIVLGTVCTVQLFREAKTGIYREIFSRFREIEAMMSANLADSDISAVSGGAGIAPVRVHPEVLDVVESALRYAGLSEGAFDPSVGPLVKLWNIGGDDARLPGEDEIRETLPLVNWRDIVVDREAGTIYLRQPGMMLDLGGIAKGYAADEAVRIIRKYRIKRAIIDLGGNVFAYGEKAGKWPWQKLPWRIGIQNPLENRGQYFAVMELRNKTAVTSGIYERFLEVDGTRYHHILSTKSGYPVESPFLSVTIIADRSMEADALSTAVFALGWEKGAALVESLGGIGAIFVFDDLSVRCAGGAENSFALTDPLYRLE